MTLILASPLHRHTTLLSASLKYVSLPLFFHARTLMLQERAQPIAIPVKFTCAFGGTILHPMADPSAKVNVATVPCKYKVGRVLGQGTYAVVKGPSTLSNGLFPEAVHIGTGKYYAAKVISKRLMAGREHMVRNEIAVLRKLSMGHESILTLVDYFETVNSCIFLECLG